MGIADTIYALSSGAGRAGVAVVRVSGPECARALATLAGDLPIPRQAALRSFRDQSGEAIDRGLALWFPAPASFTGEDVAEFHVHGGRAVVAALLRALGSVPGCRPADPGEFTRRAFANGRLDLTEVEGLGDLIAAETEAQRRAALHAATGKYGERFARWRTELIGALALVEASIDFVDEEDVPAAALRDALGAVAKLRGDLDDFSSRARNGERLREGVQVVLAGRPNAGKSTLLNALAARDVAIVSPEAGTTRDILEVHLDLSGLPVTVVDTAGLRATDSHPEQEGVRRAEVRIRNADLLLWLVAPDLLGQEPPRREGPSWIVATKADLGVVAPADHRVSAATGEGIDALLAALARFADETVGSGGDRPIVARERHRAELATCIEHLDRALDAWPVEPVEVVAEELRLAAQALGRVTGHVHVEDVLDVIFRQFCIGK